MRIVWNDNEQRFEAQFSQGEQWTLDQSAASSAGFHTDGPPSWCWHTQKASVLTKLKAQTSASASPLPLSITKPALDAYNRLRAIEERDDELKKLAKEEKKRQKREKEKREIKAVLGDESIEPEYIGQHYHEIPEYWKGKVEITRSDLPADILVRYIQREHVRSTQAMPIGKCKICGDPTYDFIEDPDLCFWCGGNGEEKFMEELIA